MIVEDEVNYERRERKRMKIRKVEKRKRKKVGFSNFVT